LEKALGPDHPDVAKPLNNLAELNSVQGKYAEAEPLYKRSLAIWEKALGPDHPNVATVCENMAECYKALGKEGQAEMLKTRARKIRLGR
jgi:tetratricopeptide (TPR) repeat protein